MTIRLRYVASHVAVVASGLLLGAGLLGILAMALAAVSFANAATTVIPLVVTFQGARDADDSPSVVIDGSLVNAVIAAALFALVWWAMMVRIGSRR
ncbi:hypothetical protein [Microbacterium sp. 22296]|uniref:hypothetical protein n=1 Tax=Microbacterium sp. 22296 TaxID=3453903 RepID=UPI003F8738E3